MASSAGAFISRARQVLGGAGAAVGERINVKADLLASAQRDLEAGRAYRNARALEKAERVMRQAQTSMADALGGGASTFDHLSETLVSSFAQWAVPGRGELRRRLHGQRLQRRHGDLERRGR